MKQMKKKIKFNQPNRATAKITFMSNDNKTNAEAH